MRYKAIIVKSLCCIAACLMGLQPAVEVTSAASAVVLAASFGGSSALVTTAFVTSALAANPLDVSGMGLLGSNPLNGIFGAAAAGGGGGQPPKRIIDLSSEPDDRQKPVKKKKKAAVEEEPDDSSDEKFMVPLKDGFQWCLTCIRRLKTHGYAKCGWTSDRDSCDACHGSRASCVRITDKFQSSARLRSIVQQWAQYADENHAAGDTHIVRASQRQLNNVTGRMSGKFPRMDQRFYQYSRAFTELYNNLLAQSGSTSNVQAPSGRTKVPSINMGTSVQMRKATDAVNQGFADIGAQIDGLRQDAGRMERLEQILQAVVQQQGTLVAGQNRLEGAMMIRNGNGGGNMPAQRQIAAQPFNTPRRTSRQQNHRVAPYQAPTPGRTRNGNVQHQSYNQGGWDEHEQYDNGEYYEDEQYPNEDEEEYYDDDGAQFSRGPPQRQQYREDNRRQYYEEQPQWYGQQVRGPPRRGGGPQRGRGGRGNSGYGQMQSRGPSQAASFNDGRPRFRQPDFGRGPSSQGNGSNGGPFAGNQGFDDLPVAPHEQNNAQQGRGGGIMGGGGARNADVQQQVGGGQQSSEGGGPEADDDDLLGVDD